MRAIALSLLLITASGAAYAQAPQEIVNLFASMSAALTDDPPNPPEFMKAFDKKMPEYDELNRSIKGLVLEWNVGGSLDFVNSTGSGVKQSVDVDWILELSSKADGVSSTRRRQIVHCELEKTAKGWRITAIKPLSFFNP